MVNICFSSQQTNLINLFRLELDSQPHLKVRQIFFNHVISQQKTFTLPSCDIKGLQCAGKNRGPITWGGGPQLCAAYEVLGLCADYFLEYIYLTNPSELNCQLSVYSELANAHFFAFACFYHIKLLI